MVMHLYWRKKFICIHYISIHIIIEYDIIDCCTDLRYIINNIKVFKTEEEENILYFFK